MSESFGMPVDDLAEATDVETSFEDAAAELMLSPGKHSSDFPAEAGGQDATTLHNHNTVEELMKIACTCSICGMTSQEPLHVLLIFTFCTFKTFLGIAQCLFSCFVIEALDDW